LSRYGRKSQTIWRVDQIVDMIRIDEVGRRVTSDNGSRSRREIVREYHVPNRGEPIGVALGSASRLRVLEHEVTM
jgi:hypothetical protein